MTRVTRIPSVLVGIFTLAIICWLLIDRYFPTLDISADEVEAEINAHLRLGDDSGKIEAYFETRGIPWSFNRFSNRFEAIIRHPESNFHAIVIYIYLDEGKRFESAEAYDSYTFL